ncbi:hypothetical protein Q4595_07805 [Wenyingzhuangia sp. 1_MG-2023]|nr:hypothetical protein [Wenyingzhuangia sp. 1_MG-2023]
MNSGFNGLVTLYTSIPLALSKPTNSIVSSPIFNVFTASGSAPLSSDLPSTSPSSWLKA